MENNIKWKTYGFKSFVPWKIKDDFIFITSGMADYILLEMMGVSYVALQSDSVYRHIPKEAIAECSGKYVIFLMENDDSSKRLSLKLQEIFHQSHFFVLNFEEMLGRTLAKGLDAVDCANEIQNIKVFEQMLENEIIKKIKGKQI